MQDQFGFAKPVLRGRIMSLMMLVAFSAVAIWSTRKAFELYHFRTIRAQRLSRATMHGKLGEIIKQASLSPTDTKLNAWVDEQFRYHKGLEQKYRTGAANPKMVLKPDPSGPPPLDLANFVRKMDAIKKGRDRVMRDFDRRNSESKDEKKSLNKQLEFF